MTDQVEMLRLLLGNESLVIRRLKTTGEAISVELPDQSMADRLIALAEERGWICTRNIGCKVSVETGNPEPSDTQFLKELLHVSVEANRASILRDGLTPGRGGNTSLSRFYKDRIHLALRRRDAFQFIHHQLTHPGRAMGGRPLVFPFEEIDLYKVVPVSGAAFFNDDHFDGRGLWTRTAIPADKLKLVERDEWHGIFRALYADHFDESYIEALR